MMKRCQYLFAIIASFVCFLFLFQTASAEERGITVKNKLAIQEEKTMRIPLTDSAIKLNGPHQEKTFYYEIDSETSSVNNEFVLYMKSSELLITPSSITVHVDDVPVVSKSLDGKKIERKVVVPLEGEALEEGFHRVTVSFYGVLKEGICVAQESSANWMSIGIDSYFKLSGQLGEKSLSLKDYSRRFIGTEKRMTTVILPNESSDDTRDNGLKIAAYLAEESGYEKSVQVVREDEAKNLPGEIIIVGAEKEFSSSFIREVMRQVKIPIEKDALSLVRTSFVEGKQRADVLFVTGENSAAMKERIPVLLKDRFIEQLSGEKLVIKKVPEMVEEDNQFEIPLKKMGIPNLTLDSTERESERFFYYAPQAIQQNSDSFLQLYLKRSETLMNEVEEEKEYDLHRDVELTIYVNDIPHSVDVRALEESENNTYRIKVPITAKPLNDSHLMSIQFKATGLRTKDPCVETDENHWIYLAEDSFLAIPHPSETAMPTLAKYPSPFIHPQEETVVVVPEDMTDAALLSFYRSVYTVGTIPNWQLVRANQLSEQNVTDANILFLSGVNTQPLLEKVQEHLLISYESGVPSLTPFGFVQEAANQVSWVQISPWNENRMMMVFDRLSEENPYVQEELLTFLKETNERATVAVQGDGEEIYTNASQVEEDGKVIGVEQPTNEPSIFSLWSILGFVVLILTVVLLLVIVLRRQRRVKE